jgi:hypothetical protein
MRKATSSFAASSIPASSRSRRISAIQSASGSRAPSRARISTLRTSAVAPAATSAGAASRRAGLSGAVVRGAPGSLDRACGGADARCGGVAGMSETTLGPPVSAGSSCSNPKAITPIVAAAASGHHHRWGRVASSTRGARVADPVRSGPAPTSRRAAARTASLSAAGASSCEKSRHAASRRGSRRSSGAGDVIAGPPVPLAALSARTESGSSPSRRRRR